MSGFEREWQLNYRVAYDDSPSRLDWTPSRQQSMVNFLDNSHGHTAVNDEVLPSDEIILEERDNQLRNLLGPAFSV